MIEKSNGARSLKAQYEEEMSRLGDEIHNLGLKEADVREAEIQVFKKSVSNAQKETQTKGIFVPHIYTTRYTSHMPTKAAENVIPTFS